MTMLAYAPAYIPGQWAALEAAEGERDGLADAARYAPDSPELLHNRPTAWHEVGRAYLAGFCDGVSRYYVTEAGVTGDLDYGSDPYGIDPRA